MRLKRLVKNAKESRVYRLKSWKRLVKPRIACFKRKMNCKVWNRSFKECRPSFSSRKTSWTFQ
jgi:hypothetical protein